MLQRDHSIRKPSKSSNWDCYKYIKIRCWRQNSAYFLVSISGVCKVYEFRRKGRDISPLSTTVTFRDARVGSEICFGEARLSMHWETWQLCLCMQKPWHLYAMSCYCFLQEYCGKYLLCQLTLGLFSRLQEVGLGFCGTPTGLLLCTIKCFLCMPLSPWKYCLRNRTLAWVLLWLVEKQVGENVNLCFIFHLFGTSMWGYESIWHLVFEKNNFVIYFSPPPSHVSYCYGTKSTVLISSLASGTLCKWGYASWKSKACHK